MVRPAAGFILGIALCAGVLVGCSTPAKSGGQDGLKVMATTGYLADAVANIAPAAEVSTLVGPGGDPHTYQPSTRDIRRILESDVVFSNGLYLEPQLAELFAEVGDRHLAAGDQVPRELLLEWEQIGPDGEPLADPHIWNSPEAWQVVITSIADKLAEQDPDRLEEYRRNAASYAKRMDTATERARSLLQAVPEDRRILVTGHDAFAYFGQAFDLEVHATDFISTEARLSAVQLSDLADLISHHRVPAVFQDNQANPQAITSLQEAVRARGWNVDVAEGELHADSLGAEEDLDTHVEVLEHNANLVAGALSGEPS